MAIGSYSGATTIVTGDVNISPVPAKKIIPIVKHFINDAGSFDMTINGATTPVVFRVAPLSNETFYVENITFIISDGGSTDVTKYGDRSALSNGVLIEVERLNVKSEITNLKNNGDIIMAFNRHVYSERDRFGGFDKVYVGRIDFTVPVILDSSTGDKITVTIRDDLRSLDYQRMSAQVWKL